MISKKLTMWNEFLSSRSIIDVPVDEGDDELAFVVSTKELRIDARADLVILCLATVVIDGSVVEIFIVVFGVLTESGTVAVVAEAIDLEMSVTVSCVV